MARAGWAAREEEVDLYGSAQHQHVRGEGTQPVPLLGERLERLHQARQHRRGRLEVRGLDVEVPVGQLGLLTAGAGAREREPGDGRVAHYRAADEL